MPDVKVFLATPMYGGMCTGHYSRSMMHVPTTLLSLGYDVGFNFIMNNSLVQCARNMLADIFLEDETATHLMFIDADIGFDAMDIVHMVKADVDVIAGIYPRKEINWTKVREAIAAGVPDEELPQHTGTLVINLLEGLDTQEVKVTEPVEIRAAGTGFMLIKREVLLGLKDKVNTYISDEGKTMYEYFYLKNDPKTNKQMSEDYAFCHLCREHGYKIYAAPWARFTHTGSYIFQGGVIPVIK